MAIYLITDPYGKPALKLVECKYRYQAWKFAPIGARVKICKGDHLKRLLTVGVTMEIYKR